MDARAEGAPAPVRMSIDAAADLIPAGAEVVVAVSTLIFTPFAALARRASAFCRISSGLSPTPPRSPIVRPILSTRSRAPVMDSPASIAARPASWKSALSWAILCRDCSVDRMESRNRTKARSAPAIAVRTPWKIVTAALNPAIKNSTPLARANIPCAAIAPTRTNPSIASIRSSEIAFPSLSTPSVALSRSPSITFSPVETKSNSPDFPIDTFNLNHASDMFDIFPRNVFASFAVPPATTPSTAFRA